jgi:uncharacterized protein (TIGR03546 family)
MLITWIAKLIAGLNANRRAGEIAAGVSMGVLLALIPGANLLWLLIFVLTVFLKLNLGIELLVLAILKPIAPLGDPLLHTLGVSLLTSEELFGLFTSLYNVPLLPFTRFNNTVVMGGVVAGLLLWLPIFFLSRVLVRVYRKRIHPRLAESKIVKAFQRIPIVSKLIAITRRFQRVYAAVR